MEHTPSLEQPYAEKFRVSIINTLRKVKIEGSSEEYYLAMRGKNPLVLNGVEYPRFQALGGGAKVSKESRKLLQETYGAQFAISGRPAEESDDARFYVPLVKDLRGLDEESTKKRNDFVAEILNQFTAEKSDAFELDIRRELYEDLVSAGVISDEELATVATIYEGAVSPLLWKTKTSEREKAEVPSFRIFHLHDMTVSKAVFEKIKHSDKIRVLSVSDIEAIHEATSRGESAAVTNDGVALVENIIPDPHGI